MSEEVLLKHEGWLPQVIRRNGRLVFCMPVSSSHATFVIELDLTDYHLNVLLADEERYHLLYAALHHQFQLQPYPSNDEVRQQIDTILLSDTQTVADVLKTLDAASNGAVSNQAKVTFKNDQTGA